MHLYYQQSTETYLAALLKRFGVPWATLHDEEFGSLATEQLVRYLNLFFRQHFGIDLVLDAECRHTLSRQNRVENVRDSFGNPGEFDAFLERYGPLLSDLV